MNIPKSLGAVYAALLAPMLALAPVLMPLLALAACGPGAPAARPPLEGARIGGAFALVDQDGRTVTDRSFPGQWRIMYFGYTFCPDVCPLDMQKVGAGLRLLEKSDPGIAAKVTPIFVTTDPERDTPAVLKQFVTAFHPRMIGLTGSPAAIAAVEKAYSVFAAKAAPAAGGGYLVNHSRQAYLMSPQNKPLALVPADESPQAVADTLKAWIA